VKAQELAIGREGKDVVTRFAAGRADGRERRFVSCGHAKAEAVERCFYARRCINSRIRTGIAGLVNVSRYNLCPAT
jgi:hypothetical protein